MEEKRYKVPNSIDTGGWCHRCNAHAYFSSAIKFSEGKQHPTQSYRERVLDFYCPKCHGVTAVVERGTADAGKWRWSVIGSWPTAAPPSVPDYLPNETGELYREAAICLSSGCCRAAAIMCRGAIDSAISDNAASGSTLYDRIKSMKGVMRQQSVDLVDTVRLGGNDAAHDFSEVWGQDEASGLFGFLELILSELYQLPVEVAEIKRLAGNRTPVGAASP